MFSAACGDAATIHGQTPDLLNRIESESVQIRTAQRLNLSTVRVARLWAKLGSDYQDAGDFAQSESAYNRALHYFETDGNSGSEHATVLDNLGSLYLVYGRLREAERLRQQAFAERVALGNLLDVARSEGHLAEIFLVEKKYKEAAEHASLALRGMRDEGDKDVDDETSTLSVLAYALCYRDACQEGVKDARRAVELSSRTFAANSLPYGYVLMAAGFAEWKYGDYERAATEMRRGIDILGQQLGERNRMVIDALVQYEKFLNSTKQKAEAKRVEAEVVQLEQEQRASCSTCTVSAFSLAASR
jgi:tetratricopeptide (TPR) repeat protein